MCQRLHGGKQHEYLEMLIKIINYNAPELHNLPKELIAWHSKQYLMIIKVKLRSNTNFCGIRLLN